MIERDLNQNPNLQSEGHMMETFRWLCMMPWASADDLAEVMGVSRSTVNRHLAGLYDSAWAVSRNVGRRHPATRRWIPTSPGLMQVYEFSHKHGGHAGPDGHVHDPIFLETDDHQHLPWWLGQSGINQLYNRIEQLEAFYPLAPRLFRGSGRDWLLDGRDAALVRLTFLRRGQLVEMFATYEGGIEIGICWFGAQLKPLRMMEKWLDRFTHEYLRWESAAEKMEFGRDQLMVPPDPDFDPTPQLAGYVCVGPDEWAVRQAMDHLPRFGYSMETPFSWWVAGRESLCVGKYGLVFPNQDKVRDRFEDIHLGEPERVALPTGAGGRDAPPAPAVLSRVLANRMLGLSEEWPAMREEDFVDLCDEFRGPVRRTLVDLVGEGLLVQVEDVYYLGDPAMIYVSDRDRISVTTVRDRLQSYLDPSKERHRHDLEHNLGMIRIVRALKRHGIQVHGGWRGVVNVRGVTQVQPDGVMYADGPCGRGVYLVEYERTAATPQDVRDKLGPYIRAAQAGVPLRAVWVCETNRGATRFRNLTRNSQAMVTTLGELEAGQMTGPTTVWRSAHGENLQLKPYS